MSTNFEDLIGRGTATPAAGVPGRLYYVTGDSTLYRDNGSTWDSMGEAGGGGSVTYYDEGAIAGTASILNVTGDGGTVSVSGGTAILNITGGAGGGTVGDLADFAYVRKTADENVASSTVFQDDDHLVFAIGASQVWDVEYVLTYNAATGGDIKFAITYPTGGTITAFSDGPGAGWAGDSNDGVLRSQALTPASGSLCAAYGGNKGGAGNDPLSGRLRVLAINGTVAGNIQLQWAQLASSATNTTVYTNSYLIARRVV